MQKPSLACLPLLLACSAAVAADNCDSIRAQIDTRIRATGVADFALTTVDTASTAPGKVVGSCALGSKKIVYLQAGSAAGRPAAAASATNRQPAKPGNETIITECKDGSVSRGGDCKK